MSAHPIPVQGEEPNARAAGLSAAKRALLELRLKKGGKPAGRDAIPRRRQRDLVPLSFAQELLWLLDQLNPNLSVYSVPRAMRAQGPLDVGALRRVLDTIVNRHEVLRTTFALRDDHPVQVIAEQATVDLRQIDLSGVPAATQDQEVQRLLLEEALRPFDLARDLMFRAVLLKLAPEDHVLFLGTHHIASDGWSKSVLFEELKTLYGAYTNGQPSPLPELPIQYADFAVWQRQELEGKSLEKQLAYWKQQLAGAPPLLELHGDRPRPAVQTFRGAFVRVVYPKPLADAFKALSQKEGATLFMTLLAAFDAWVYRCTGQEDVVLGTPIAGRNRPEMEGLIGYFTNTLALRSDVSGNPTFRELLGRVRHMALAAYEHQDLPFEKLVVELKPERNLSYSPVFQILFSVGHVGAQVPDLPGLTTTPVEVDRGVTKFDLTVGMTDRKDGLAVNFEYSTDLYEAATISRMLESFRVLLEGIVANPDCRVNDLPLLPAAEREQVVAGWNDTRADLPQDARVHRLIEAQAERTPDAPAICFGGRQLTYRELNTRANQLAHYLRQQGVGPEVLVGLCVERSLDMAVGLLGVLKAGGAFLPLDPSYPKSRLDAMLRDARVPVLLTQQHLRERLPAHHAAVICLDADGPAIAAESDADPAAPVAPDHPAYVIYTSGSTGTPRGVVVTHRSLVNHNLAAIKLYGFGPDDRVLQAASLSFDIAVEEIFPTWVAGAAVVLRPPDLPLAGVPFLHWLGQNRVTVLDLPTAFWHEWVSDLSALREPLPESLRLVIVGGEKAQAPVFAAWRKLAGDRVRWVNTYGPTEATVIATAHEPAADDEAAELPIGRPIANTQAYILDRSLRPVPVNVTGELYLAGVGVARGYLNQPGRTAERFLPCPFGTEPGARMYRTGDLARFRADGSIEFLGRADHQVKIRGFRIEPGEIEAVLGRHPAVREVVVLAREDAAGPKRLVAYVVPGGEAPAARALQDYVRERLPDYMVPAAFVFLPALPKTPNGKVDRKALPAPGSADTPTGSAFVAPRDAVEAELAMLWESILGVRPVGVRDDFFELGGHSLLAVRLFARIQQVFGKSLSLATMFRAPTVEQLAEVLRQGDDPATWAPVIPIQPGGSRPPFFCVAAPNVNALGFVFLARRLGPDQPMYGLQSQYGGKRRQVYSREEYRAVAADYIAAMRQVQPQGPYFLGGTCEGSHIAFEMARQLTEAGQEVGLLAMLDAWPLENSSSYFLHAYVHYYMCRVRSLLSGGLRRWAREHLTGPALVRKLAGLFRRRPARSPGSAPAPLPGEDWKARLWPGKDFVPPTIPTRITVFRIREQPYWRVRDEQLCWGTWTKSGVDVHYIPGRHDTILREPNVRILAEELGRCLERARADGKQDGAVPAGDGGRN
jgi:amino acid adenylation domain-containing protein